MSAEVAELSVRTGDAEETRLVGAALANILRRGDLVILSGGLGAGKTTLVQGLGSTLGVRGRITSPTYIISRTHRSTTAGPDLIHVDAYRVEDDLDLETIDLDGALDEAVTVVEWGAGKVEALSSERFEVHLESGADTDAREITIRALGAEQRGRLAQLQAKWAGEKR